MAAPTRSSSEPRTLVTHPELRSQQSFPFFQTLGEPKKNALERLLSLFADVRAGEGVGALLLALNVFLLLAAYYILRPIREPLVLQDWGKDVAASVAAYSSAAQAVLLIGIVPLYGWLASRLRRIRLIAISSLFFAANLVLFSIAGQAGAREGALFFIWVGIFNVFVISQFWQFSNDLYTEGQGRRLFPMIGMGASLGAAVGSATITPLVRRLGFTPFTLMLVAGALVVIALMITVVVNRGQTSRDEPEAKKIDQEPLSRKGGFELILKDRYLTWIALLIILLNVVNTTGEYLLRRLVYGAADTQFALEFYASFNQYISILTLLVQLFVTSRAIRFLGVRGSLFILPVLALVNYSVIAIAPLLAVVRVGKILENSTDYSIQNTVRQALFLPTSREAKYKAKAAIDTFCHRTGDVLQAGLVYTGTTLGFGVPAFAWVSVGLTLVWLWIAGRISREHRKKTV